MSSRADLFARAWALPRLAGVGRHRPSDPT
jgi:hypothetical protein